MKTIKQIADEIGVSKTAVRKHLTDEVKTKFAETVSGTIYINDAGEMLIKSAFEQNVPQTKFAGVSANQFVEVSTLVSMLQGELEIKNEQIRELNNRLAESNAALVAAQQTAQAAQMLHAGTIQKQLTGGEPPDGEEKKKGFFGLFRK
jgi:Predicted transcriptional regulator